MDWKDDASRQMDKMKNNAEIGAEKIKKSYDNVKHDVKGKINGEGREAVENVEKGMDNAKHDAKIKMTEEKEKLQQDVHDIKKNHSDSRNESK